MPYAENNGTKIYWEADGAGEPILMIMGLGYTHDMWHRTRPVLAKHYRLILFDNRGVGKSDAPAGPYSILQMADDAAAVLSAAGVDAAHVIGVSMGGMIAQELALKYPSRVRKLVLACTACGGPKVVRAESAVNEALMARGTMSLEDAAVAVLPYIYDAGTPRERIDEDLDVRRRATLPQPAPFMAQLFAILGWQSYDRLPQIGSPTLVIHGEHDKLVPPGNGRLIAESIPNARLVLLPNASHIFTTDQPEAAHRELLSFLNS